MTSKEPKAEELRALLLAKGYNVECEWRTEGWHFALTKPHSFRSVFVFDHGIGSGVRFCKTRPSRSPPWPLGTHVLPFREP